jgi:hypothetical protein
MKKIQKQSKKCKATNKTKFKTERLAGKAMMRIWAHDTSANIYDLHTYICPSCGDWHIGHISYYRMELAKKENTNETLAQTD